MDRYLNTLYDHRRWLIAWAILLSFSAVGFHFDGTQISMWWESFPLAAVSLVTLGLMLLFLYVSTIQHQMDLMCSKIDHATGDSLENLPGVLTTRQEQIFYLILAGKSNKEIMAELFIELSTLKSHINQIYKKLKVRTRTELKRKHSKRE